ncbi:FdhF/YdeP family oxidoreductase [Streptomyces sp. NBC_01803]|uniref:FdhF/YdeP family oxidoreductase n=1 Tax=Streptomyces sp. NBC_01803 TaxID=2975946 RepID=UPI002DD9F525|nr:FdhF/YdeP family oxidoreductase [Streptomyces sp. NBC_01803]WSA43332.1 FdhF/YdeP family oxidoreductase [Streptomyces sp. NBC_01803]
MARKAPREDPGEDALEVTAPKTWAAGIPAVTHALRMGYDQMGVRRTALSLLKVNQKDGFDCPGCAWPEGDHRSKAEFCENGAKAVAEEATVRRVTPEFFAAHPVSDLLSRSDYWLGQQGRLTEPMYKPAGSETYVPVTWETAFTIVSRELKALRSPDEAAFYTSGRTSNEAAYLYQLLVRQFGTNNLPDCSNMCHESSGSALTETIGVGKGSVHLDDLHRAGLIFVVGQNPGTNHPRMLSALEKAKRRGARIVAVNPLPEAGLLRFKNPQNARGVAGGGTSLADRFLQIRLGGDMALFQALSRLLLDAEDAAPGTVLDRDFITAHTDGFEAYAERLRELDWDDVAEATGLARDAIEATARDVMSAQSIVVCWAMGLTQHKHSVPTIREVVNFLLLRGDIGRPGAGVCPVRGHSNVQGDRTMGIYEKPAPEFLDALRKEFGFDPPRHHGFDAVETIRAMGAGEVKVFFAMGGNFVSAAPDTAVTERALRSCRLTVQVSTKLNRSHAVCGREALILPVLGRTERDRGPDGADRFVTVENSMGVVHASRGGLPPASPHLLSEPEVVCRLARGLFGAGCGAATGSDVPWAAFGADYDAVRDSIARVVPGFDDFNARVRRPGGFTLPNAPRDERRFPTRTGKANFTVNPLEVPRVPPGRLLLQTLRSHDQYNTTIYGLDDRYRGIRRGRRVVFVHPDDLAERGITDGGLVDLVSEWPDGLERRADAFRAVAYDTPRGCCAAYFPEANVLVPLDSVADTSNTPTSKSIVVRLERRGSPSGGPGEAQPR